MLWLTASAEKSCLPPAVCVAKVPPSCRMRSLALVVNSAMSSAKRHCRSKCESRVPGGRIVAASREGCAAWWMHSLVMV